MIFPDKSMFQMSQELSSGVFSSNAQLLGLDGIVVESLDELRERVRAVRSSADVDFFCTKKDGLSLNKYMRKAGWSTNHYLGYDIYTISDGVMGKYVAYGCKACDKIIVGSPILQILPSSTASQECALWNCGKCNVTMMIETSSYREHSLM